MILNVSPCTNVLLRGGGGGNIGLSSDTKLTNNLMPPNTQILSLLGYYN